MNDVGVYCHDWEFSIHIDPNDLNSLDTVDFPDDPGQCECGYDLETYILDIVYESLTL